MDRRLVVPGAVLVGLMVATGALSVVAWDATLAASDRSLASAERTTLGELPPECRGFARSIAAGEPVAIAEYRIGAGPAEVVLRRTPGDGWTLGSAACTPRLRTANDLRVGNASVNVVGEATRTAVHREPAVGAARLLVGLAGVGLVALGAIRG